MLLAHVNRIPSVCARTHLQTAGPLPPVCKAPVWAVVIALILRCAHWGRQPWTTALVWGGKVIWGNIWILDVRQNLETSTKFWLRCWTKYLGPPLPLVAAPLKSNLWPFLYPLGGSLSPFRPKVGATVSSQSLLYPSSFRAFVLRLPTVSILRPILCPPLHCQLHLTLHSAEMPPPQSSWSPIYWVPTHPSLVILPIVYFHHRTSLDHLLSFVLFFFYYLSSRK